MGYTTEFFGEIDITPALNSEEIAYLRDFSESRRIHRSRGPLYAVPGSDWGQSGNTEDVLDYNRPDPDQPGLWCQWVPAIDGSALTWDEGEKFYNAAEWMTYLVTNLLAPSARPYVDAHVSEDPRLAAFTCDHHLTGEIEARGEDHDDVWRLVVTDNEVTTIDAEVVFRSATERAELARLTASAAALSTMVEVLGNEEIGHDVGCAMTCVEADCLARVMQHLGHTGAATSFLIGHSASDEDGDLHFWPQAAGDVRGSAKDYALAL
ncbi:MAG: hypothetical protein AAGC63_14795 [Propionicimonas sp.]